MTIADYPEDHRQALRALVFEALRARDGLYLGELANYAATTLLNRATEGAGDLPAIIHKAADEPATSPRGHQAASMLIGLAEVTLRGLIADLVTDSSPGRAIRHRLILRDGRLAWDDEDAP